MNPKLRKVIIVLLVLGMLATFVILPILALFN